MSDTVRIGPAVWPGPALAVQPGDLTRFATHGYGFGAPLVMQPWDSLADVLARPNYYGTEPPPTGNPFADAPRTATSGGTIYFDDDVDRAEFEAALGVMNALLRTNAYAAFETAATEPVRQRYLVQRRIVPSDALAVVFGIAKADLANDFVTQPVDAVEAMHGFLADQRARYGTGMSDALEGTLGGDGDWARESLAFGLTVENAEHGIVRLWSRPWLVTK